MNPHQNIVTPIRGGCNADLISFFILAVVIATLAVAPAYAQSGDAVRAAVPFGFRVGDLQVPAGKYTIEGVTTWSMILRDSHGQERLLAMSSLLAQANDRRLEPKLVFHRYGSQYFLAEIWTVQRGQKLSSGLAERDAMATKPPVDVAIAAHASH
jgi:hypothetical protein